MCVCVCVPFFDLVSFEYSFPTVCIDHIPSPSYKILGMQLMYMHIFMYVCVICIFINIYIYICLFMFNMIYIY